LITRSTGIDLLEIDHQIVRIARAEPGIAQADLVRDLIRTWSPMYLRQRIEILAARGSVRTERRNGRLYVYPVTEVAAI